VTLFFEYVTNCRPIYLGKSAFIDVSAHAPVRIQKSTTGKGEGSVDVAAGLIRPD